jgi:hypothetical protein
MFEHLVETIRDQGQGVRAWETCAREAATAVDNKPDLAAPYFLLGVAAGRFVEIHFGEPLTGEKAQIQLDRFEGYAAKLGKAFSGDDEALKLKTLNEVAAELLKFGK